MSEPGVWVILAVCQSGVGNGHGVITAALTGSSISLYRALCLSHPPAARVIFFLLAALRRGMEERKTDRVTARHTGNERAEGTRRRPSQIAVIRLV